LVKHDDFYTKIVGPKACCCFLTFQSSRNSSCLVRSRSFLRKRHSVFEFSLVYDCPEPVLVKCSFFYINGSKRTVFTHRSAFQRFFSVRSAAADAACRNETKRNETKRNETKATVFQRHLALVLSLAWQIIAFHKEEKQRLSPHAPLRTRRRQTLIARNLHTCSGGTLYYVQASGLVAPFSLRCGMKTAGFERKRLEI
jgi:hypothetical protein